MPQTQTTPANDDNLTSGMQVLIFLGNLCITPVIGIVLYFVWKNQKPNSAKKVLTLTLSVLALYAVLTICLVVLTSILGVKLFA